MKLKMNVFKLKYRWVMKKYVEILPISAITMATDSVTLLAYILLDCYYKFD